MSCCRSRRMIPKLLPGAPRRRRSNAACGCSPPQDAAFNAASGSPRREAACITHSKTAGSVPGRRANSRSAG